MKTESAGSGYVFVILHGHPMSDSRGRVLEHRFVMSKHLGRIIGKDEVVHHIDGDRKNNSIENLELMTRPEHTRIHSPCDLLELVCPECGSSFERARRNARGKRTFCSRSCAARFYKNVNRGA